MKKYFLVVFCAALLFVVTGCGSKNEMKCTGTMEENGQKVEAEVTAEFDKDDKLVDATIVEDLGSEETAKQLCSLYQTFSSEMPEGVSVSCSGSKVTIKGFAKMNDSEDEEDKMIGLTKEEFKTKMESETEGKVTCK